MSQTDPILDVRLGDFLGALASASPAAAGGVSALATTAIAAALVSGCARRSGDWDEASATAGQAERLRGRATALLANAGETYESAFGSLAVAGESPAPTPQSDWALGEAVRAAAEAPATGAEVAADVADLAAETATKCDPSCRPDALAACRLADAAAKTCAELVRINLVAGTGPQADEAVAAAARSGAALARVGTSI